MLLRRIARTAWLSIMQAAERSFLRELGRRLRERREARGWTQAELAAKCELHRTFIGSVERGERNVSVLNLRRIAAALRMPLEELLAQAGLGAEGGRAPPPPQGGRPGRSGRPRN